MHKFLERTSWFETMENMAFPNSIRDLTILSGNVRGQHTNIQQNSFLLYFSVAKYSLTGAVGTIWPISTSTKLSERAAKQTQWCLYSLQVISMQTWNGKEKNSSASAFPSNCTCNRKAHIIL